MFFLESVNKFAAHNAEVMGNGDSMFVVQGVTIGSSTDWDGVDAASGCSIQVQGTIMSVGGNGLVLSGNDNHVDVGTSGALLGNLNAGSGLDATTGHLSLTNAGEIRGTTAIYCGSSDNTINNSGHISGSTGSGIHIVWALSNYISNTGIVESTGNDAILIDTGGGGFSRLDNSGTIRAAGGHMAINIALGFTEVTNTGHIFGDVQLPDSNSFYEGSAGTIDGAVLGGAGDDSITTGVGRDLLIGLGGADLLEGGPGRDTFSFITVSDSTGTAHDTITDFDFKHDFLSFNGSVSEIDRTVASGRLRGTHFDTDLAKAADAGHLGIGHAVLFTPTTGSERGDVFLVIDRNGVAGYQANADYVVEMHNPDNIGTFSLKDFSN